MYWTYLAELNVDVYSGRATENLRELLNVTNILPKLISYIILRLLGKSGTFLFCFETVTVISAGFSMYITK